MGGEKNEKSGLIKKRVDKERRVGRIGTCLEESGAEAKGDQMDKKGGTIGSKYKNRDTSNTYIIISTHAPSSI